MAVELKDNGASTVKLGAPELKCPACVGVGRVWRWRGKTADVKCNTCGHTWTSVTVATDPLAAFARQLVIGFKQARTAEIKDRPGKFYLLPEEMVENLVATVEKELGVIEVEARRKGEKGAKPAESGEAKDGGKETPKE